jgi:hypothetical protein
MRSRPSRRWLSRRPKPSARFARARVALGELTYERSERAASACLTVLLQRDERAEPPVDAGPRVEVIEQPVLREQDRVRRRVDHRTNEIVAVVEVVIELAAAGVGTLADVVEARGRRALLGHQLGLHDACARVLRPFAVSVRGMTTS